MSKIQTRSGRLGYSYPAFYWRPVRCRSCGLVRYGYKELKWFLTFWSGKHRSTVSRYIPKRHWPYYGSVRTLNSRPSLTCICIGISGPSRTYRRLSPNPPMRSGLGVGTRGEGRGTRRSALDSDKWGRWRPLVGVGGADGGPGQRRWGGVGGTACKGRQSRTGPVRLCGVVE